MSKKQGSSDSRSTGSIGGNTWTLSRGNPELRVVALSADTNAALLAEQCREFEPRYAVMADPERAGELRERLHSAGVNTEALAGAGELARIAALPEVDTVMAAIVGAAGLESTLSAIQAGKKVLLANKESLVMAGDLCMRTARWRAPCCPGGQRTQRRLSVPSPLRNRIGGRADQACGKTGADLFRRTVSALSRGTVRLNHSRTGLQPPEMGHGSEDFS